MACGTEIGCAITFVEMSNGVPENHLESMGITWAGDLNLRLMGTKIIPEIVQKRVSERG